MIPVLNKTLFLFSNDKKLFRSLKNILGFSPSNINLYKLAFRHRSACKDKSLPNNERLEFLGDAVLSTVVGHYLFLKFPFKDEGFLTKMRSKIVSRNQINHVASKIGIGEFVELAGARDVRNSSINGNAFEALIGAVFIDRGYRKAEDFILKKVLAPHIDIDEIEQIETDYKSKLIEWAQKEKVSYAFQVKEELGVGSDKQFIVELLLNNVIKGKGQHFSKKRAEQIAAEGAMEQL